MMPACRLEHRKRAVDVGPEISLRQLDRRHDVGARRQMENSVGTGAHRVNRRHVGNVGFDDLKTLFIAVLLQIRSAANDKTVQHTNPPPSRNQPIDKMAADKASATGHNIKIGQYPLRSPGRADKTLSRPAPNAQFC